MISITTIESLESRQLLADATFELTATGTLIVRGISGLDAINVSLLHDKPEDGFRVTVSNTPTPRQQVVTQEYRAKFKAVKRIYVDAGGGNDQIFIGSGNAMTRPVTMLGGSGDDQLNYSSTGPIFAAGGKGNDVVGRTAIIVVNAKKNSDVLNAVFAVENKTGVCTIQGNDGNDTLSGDTNDLVDGGAGIDVARLVLSSAKSLAEARRNGLASDYYTRLGAINVEVTLGSNLFS